MRTMLALLALSLLLPFTGCASGETSPTAPDIEYGVDICDECSMIISDERFAAGYAHEAATDRYESKAFDDIGGMLLHAEKHSDDKIAAWYVHDYESVEWLDATMATYVVSPDIPTPMGYGILAFASETAAQDAATAVDGMVMTWDELREADIAHGH